MKAMKKIMSLLLVLAMAMSLSLTAFAAEPTLKKGTLTVTGPQLNGKKVTVVRMFTANVDDKNNNSQIDKGDIVAYELEEKWQPFFDKQLSKSGEEHATSEDAYNYVNNQEPEETLITFAKAAKEYYNANAEALSSLKTEKTVDTNNTATFTELETGYYLVLPANGSTNANRATDAMIVNVPGEKAARLELKTEYPTVDKTVTPDGGHGTSAQIGDKLTFTLTSKVPNMDDYKTYIFNFKDTMSKGLTLDESSVKVTINDQPVAKEYYEVSPTVIPQGETILEVKFSNLKEVPEATADAVIKVEYSATLNKDAQVGKNNSNDNKAELEYSNDPTGNGTGTSEPSITKTYTFAVQIHKYANNEKATLLPGAEFQLQSEGGDVIKLVKELESEHIYHVATQGEIDGGEAKDTFVTVDKNNIVINGLKAGAYKLAEINPPVGYNKLNKPVELEIQAQYEEDGSLKAGSPKYVVTGTATTEGNIIEVQNRSGVMLPETGSIGTIGLTMLGVSLVIGGIGFTSRKKKEQE